MKNILIIIFLLISFKVYAKCEKALDSGKIVGAGGSITETIFFLGLEKNLVARDLTSNFPDQASSLPSIGYLRNLSVEGLLSLSPTLILSEPDIGPEKVVEQIKKTSVEMRILADDYSSSGIIDKVNCIGKILGAEKPYIQKKNISFKAIERKAGGRCSFKY